MLARTLVVWRIGAYGELAYIWRIDYGELAYGEKAYGKMTSYLQFSSQIIIFKVSYPVKF